MSFVVESGSLVRDTSDLSEALRCRCVDRRQFHTSVQLGIAQLARKYGVRAAREYPVTRYDHRCGLIDVVWLLGSSPVAAFEIDAARRKKSILKLLSLEVPLRFWIYCGCQDGATFLRTVDPDGSVQLIQQRNVRSVRHA